MMHFYKRFIEIFSETCVFHRGKSNDTVRARRSDLVSKL